MAEVTILRRTKLAGPHSWLLCNGDGREETPGELGELLSRVAEPFAVLLDAASVLLTEVELPTSNPRLAAQALPFELEDRLLAPAGELHFAQRKIAAHRYAVAVVAKAIVEPLFDALQRAQSEPLIVASEAQALPLEAGAWTVLLDGEQAWLRCSENGCFALPGHALPALLDAEVARRGVPASVLLFARQEQAMPALSDTLRAVEWRRFEIVTPAECFSAGLRPAGMVDLMPASGKGGSGRQRRRRLGGITAGLLLMTLLVHAGMAAWSSQRLINGATAAIARTEARFRELFPDATRIVDVRAQTAARLAELEGKQEPRSSFLPLFAAFNRALTTAGVLGVQLQSATFTGATLDLRVAVDAVASLDAIRRALQTELPVVELVSVESAANGVVGLLRLRAVR